MVGMAGSGGRAALAAAKGSARERMGAGEAALAALEAGSGEASAAGLWAGLGAGRLEACSSAVGGAPRALASAGAMTIATSEHEAILNFQRARGFFSSVPSHGS